MNYSSGKEKKRNEKNVCDQRKQETFRGKWKISVIVTCLGYVELKCHVNVLMCGYVDSCC